MKSRSLYVEDIPGATPKRHVYDKKIYHEKLEEQISRFARFSKNPEQKRIIDWHVAPRKKIESVDKNNQEYWRTKRSLINQPRTNLSELSKSMILSRSQIFGQAKNQQNLSKSALQNTQKKLSLYQNKSQLNPYFPHKYVDTRMGESNKWSGSKIWQHDATKVVQLPSIDQCYFKKWF